MTDSSAGPPIERAYVVETIRAHLEAQFPRDCPCCAARFSSLADYLRRTRHVGPPLSFDAVGAEAVLNVPEDPVGTMSFANCRCGTTLSLGSDGMPNATIIALMTWARHEVQERGISLAVLLTELRSEIDRAVLT